MIELEERLSSITLLNMFIPFKEVKDEQCITISYFTFYGLSICYTFTKSFIFSILDTA
jgi:hypothetical protein